MAEMERWSLVTRMCEFKAVIVHISANTEIIVPGYDTSRERCVVIRLRKYRDSLFPDTSGEGDQLQDSLERDRFGNTSLETDRPPIILD